jgi:hypothetical protein
MDPKRTLTVCLATAALLSAPSAVAQVQVAKLLASDTGQGDQFGIGVAISGDWQLVGAPYDDDIAVQSGAVYVYRRINGSWSEVQKLKASDAAFGAQFGLALAIDGARAVITAPGDSPLGILAAGSAYVFELAGATWVETGKVWASDAANQVFAGQAVALSGTRIVMGSWSASPAGLNSGEAYVFELQGSSWIQVAQILGSDTVSADYFGITVAIDGTRAVIGAGGADLPQGFGIGAAYVFERNSQGAWLESVKLTPNDGLHDDFFGVVAVSGDTILVGAPARDDAGSQSGAAYFFQKQGAAWTQLQRVNALDGNTDDQFGAWVALSGDLAVMTANGDTEAGSNSGSAYAFQRSPSGWIQIGKLVANDASASDLFGLSVAVSNTTIAVGAPRDDEACPQQLTCDSGSSYVFEVVPTAIQYGSCPSGAPCGNDDAHGGCRNSTGEGAVLGARGSSSLVADDLVLETRHLPPGTSGLLFMGGGQTSAPFGDGRRVVSSGSSGVHRLGIQQADTNGVLIRGPGLGALSQGLPGPGHITPGQTWNFQLWYRNTAGPCGALFNLSNGVSVRFTP